VRNALLEHGITRVFWTFVSENLRPPLIFLVPGLGWGLERVTSFSQKCHTGWGVFVVTISIAVRIRITKALARKFVLFSTLIVVVVSTRVVFLRE